LISTKYELVEWFGIGLVCAWGAERYRYIGKNYREKIRSESHFCRRTKGEESSLEGHLFNSKLEQGYQVRGVVYCMFCIFLNGYILLYEDCMIFPLFDVIPHCSIEVSGFFQKPPGGSTPTARRHIIYGGCS